MAFDGLEKDAVVTKEVDNSVNTTDTIDNPFVCENTYDKIYLLSYQDLQNEEYGFYDDYSRCAKVTDYAKAVGACWNTASSYFNNGYYWLRSPSSIDCNGNEGYCATSEGAVENYLAFMSRYGIRVACTFDFNI